VPDTQLEAARSLSETARAAGLDLSMAAARGTAGKFVATTENGAGRRTMGGLAPGSLVRIGRTVVPVTRAG